MRLLSPPRRRAQLEREFIVSNDMTVTERVALDRLLTIADVDCRKGPGRRVRAIVRSLARDLADDLSTAQRMMVMRVAMLEALCTNTEAAILLGQEVSIDDYLQMANTQRRLLQTLGLRRVPKDVTPSLSDILREAQP
jgi:hypothetical protein